MAPTADCALALYYFIMWVGLAVTALLQACIAKVTKLTVVANCNHKLEFDDSTVTNLIFRQHFYRLTTAHVNKQPYLH